MQEKNGKTPESNLAVFYKLYILLLKDSEIELWGIDPNEVEMSVNLKTRKHVFTATVFVIANKLKEPRYSLIATWINKLRTLIQWNTTSVKK